MTTTLHPSGQPSLPAPANTTGPIAWLRARLFSSPANALLTLAGLYLLWLILPPLVQWAFIQADWTGASRDACTSDGACWAFIAARWNTLIYGFYPASEYWRPNLVFASFAALLIALHLPQLPRKALALFLVLVFPFLAFWLFRGGLGLMQVPTDQWGGLMLTVILGVVGMVGALPLGILLALGRRSNLPLLSGFCTVFIELWRGVPLITVLFMSSVLFPLFLPEGVSIDKLLRATVAIILFMSAYVAEVVRGGLQALPKGQFEAAAAVGLGYWRTTGFIILPQALKIVIPGIVVTFVQLFKDTSLVLIIGLFDLLGMVKQALTDPKWLGLAIEGYVFVALIYWAFCFGASRYAAWLEGRLHTGHR